MFNTFDPCSCIAQNNIPKINKGMNALTRERSTSVTSLSANHSSEVNDW